MSKMFTGKLLQYSVNQLIKKGVLTFGIKSFEQTNQKGGIHMNSDFNNLST